MKKMYLLSILAFLICISISLKSQEYIPFPPDATSEWRIDEQWWNPDPWEITTNFYRMYFDGTEQIGDLTFNLLYADGESVWNPPNGYPPVVSTFEHEYLGRICTHESKVYFNFPDNLLFDYSWQVGDTVKDCVISENCSNGYNPLIIASIDSIELNGRYHLRFNFDDSYGNITWFIEGIGHEYGIFHQACIDTDYGSYFECYAENSEPIFPEDANCILTVGLDEITEISSPFEIFPNPSSTQITITSISDSNNELQISISDLTGRVLMNEFWEQNQGNNFRSVDLSGFDSGIYFVRLSDRIGKTIASKKLIVE